jgi:cyanophycinase
MGAILLEGGSEFGGLMEEPDRRALSLAGGRDASVRIIPAAAAPDNNHERAGRNGVAWFESLGARDVAALKIIDPDSANEAKNALEIEEAGLIYLLGGFPRHLCETLKESLVWQAALAACEKGAVLAGSSAGAMVLCEWYFDPYEGQVLRGLDLLRGCCVLPHFETFGASWIPSLEDRLPDALLIGIEEQTGMINHGPAGRWQVYGKGAVELCRAGRTRRRFVPGKSFELDENVILRYNLWFPENEPPSGRRP